MLTAAREGRLIITILDTPEDEQISRELGLLTAKPMLYIINVDETDAGKVDEMTARFSQVSSSRRRYHYYQCQN